MARHDSPVGPGSTPPKAGRIDYMCSHCGRIKAGPHAGKRVKLPADPHDMPTTYYGAPISHSLCDPACQEMKRAALQEKRALGGRTTSGAGYNTAAHREAVRVERNAAREVEAEQKKLDNSARERARRSMLGERVIPAGQTRGKKR